MASREMLVLANESRVEASQRYYMNQETQVEARQGQAVKLAVHLETSQGHGMNQEEPRVEAGPEYATDPGIQRTFVRKATVGGKALKLRSDDVIDRKTPELARATSIPCDALVLQMLKTGILSAAAKKDPQVVNMKMHLIFPMNRHNIPPIDHRTTHPGVLVQTFSILVIAKVRRILLNSPRIVLEWDEMYLFSQAMQHGSGVIRSACYNFLTCSLDSACVYTLCTC